MMEDIYKVIRNIKEDLLKRHIPLKSASVYDYEGTEYETDTHKLNRFMSLTANKRLLYVMYNMVYETYYDTTSEMGKRFFTKLETPNLCNGVISIFGYNIKRKLTTKIQIEGETYKIKESYEMGKFQKLCRNILYEMERKKCVIQAIELSLSTVEVSDEPIEEEHENLLLIHKDRVGYTVVLYEPHGSISSGSMEIKMTDLFLEYFERFFWENDIPVVMIPRYHVSCPKGLQIYARDKIGLCVIFSIFWYYCFLVVTRDLGLEISDGEMFRNLVEDLEMIIKNVFSQEELLSAVYGFANMFTETALMLNNTTDYEEYRTARRMKRQLSESDDMTLLEDMHVSKRFHEYRRLEEETSPRKYNNDGQECKKNTDCGSGNCCDNICTAISYYETPCDKNCECASGVCNILSPILPMVRSGRSKRPRGVCSVINPEENDKKKLNTMFSKMTLDRSPSMYTGTMFPDIKKR